MTQIILPHTYRAQQRGWSCGAATAQVVLSTYGITVTEEQMIAECGTTVDGTADVANIVRVLNARTKAGYSASYLRQDPPTATQRDDFWAACVATIAGQRRGMPINIWAPANNHPPGYPGYMIMHFISGVGIDTDTRRVYISDSARFSGIEHYWLSADSLATMITPKGFGRLPAAPDPLVDVRAQMCGGTSGYPGFPQLGGRTLVDGIAAVLKALP